MLWTGNEDDEMRRQWREVSKEEENLFEGKQKEMGCRWRVYKECQRTCGFSNYDQRKSVKEKGQKRKGGRLVYGEDGGECKQPVA